MATKKAKPRKVKPRVACPPPRQRRSYTAQSECRLAPRVFVSEVAEGGNGSLSNPWRGYEGHLNALPDNARVKFTNGCYLAAEPVEVRKGWQIDGDGSLIQSTPDFIGPVFRAAAPPNASTAGNLRIKDLSIENKNFASKGAAIAIVGYTHVDIDHVTCINWPCGMLFDQAEIVFVNRCQFELFGGKHMPQMRAIWYVNGPHNAVGLTNVQHVDGCFFNGDNPDQTYIVDDGGYSHTISRNTFNHAGAAFRLAGAFPVAIRDNYFESQARPNVISHKRADGSTGVGGCYGLICDGNMVAQHVTWLELQSSVGTLALRSNQFYGSAKVHVKGIANVVKGKLDVSADNYWAPGTKLTE